LRPTQRRRVANSNLPSIAMVDQQIQAIHGIGDDEGEGQNILRPRLPDRRAPLRSCVRILRPRN
jgi:hypothetical protein